MSSLLIEPFERSAGMEMDLQELVEYLALIANCSDEVQAAQILQAETQLQFPYDTSRDLQYMPYHSFSSPGFTDPNFPLDVFPIFDSMLNSLVPPVSDSIYPHIQPSAITPATPPNVETLQQVAHEDYPEPYKQCVLPSINTAMTKVQSRVHKNRTRRDYKKPRIFKLKKAPHKPIRALLGPIQAMLAKGLVIFHDSPATQGGLLNLHTDKDLEFIRKSIPWSRATGGVPDTRFLDAVYQGNTIYAAPDVDIRPLFCG